MNSGDRFPTSKTDFSKTKEVLWKYMQRPALTTILRNSPGFWREIKSSQLGPTELRVEHTLLSLSLKVARDRASSEMYLTDLISYHRPQAVILAARTCNRPVDQIRYIYRVKRPNQNGLYAISRFNSKLAFAVLNTSLINNFIEWIFLTKRNILLFTEQEVPVFKIGRPNYVKTKER